MENAGVPHHRSANPAKGLRCGKSNLNPGKTMTRNRPLRRCVSLLYGVYKPRGPYDPIIHPEKQYNAKILENLSNPGRGPIQAGITAKFPFFMPEYAFKSPEWNDRHLTLLQNNSPKNAPKRAWTESLKSILRINTLHRQLLGL